MLSLPLSVSRPEPLPLRVRVFGPLSWARSPQSWLLYEISKPEGYKGPYRTCDPISPQASMYGILDRGPSPSV